MFTRRKRAPWAWPIWVPPLLAMVGCAGSVATRQGPWPPTRIVDLTHAFDSETVYWPTEEGFVLERGTAGVTDGGYYYEAHRFRGAEHGGTHVDAPIHFWEGGESVDAIGLDRLVAPAVVVDVSDACRDNPDHQVGTEELRRWEKDHGLIPRGSILLLRTGFSGQWPDRSLYLGTDQRGVEAVSKLRFPGLAPEAARWLAQERKIAAIGLDTASIDPGSSTQFGSHVELFSHGIPAFENVANLELLPATGALVVALPMKIRGGSGAPLRIIALVPE